MSASPAPGGRSGIGRAAPAFAPPTVVHGVTSTNLVGFAPATPGTQLTDTAISGLGIGETIAGMDFRTANGLQYLLTVDGLSIGRL